MDDSQLLRYSRQILLPEFGTEGQERLADSRALIIGTGGLGSPVAMYLAAAGVGELVLTDHDQVELSNLQRQIIHTTASIGRPKVSSAATSIHNLNPDCRTVEISHRLDEKELAQQAELAQVVLDCSDNFATRFAVNRACVQTRTPLVSGAAIRWEGQVAVFNDQPAAPCYRCLYGESGEPEDSCTQNGVLAPIVGIIGCIQATEAIKVLTNIGETLSGRLLILDAITMQWRSLNLKADPDCPVCGH